MDDVQSVDSQVDIMQPIQSIDSKADSQLLDTEQETIDLELQNLELEHALHDNTGILTVRKLMIAVSLVLALSFLCFAAIVSVFPKNSKDRRDFSSDTFTNSSSSNSTDPPIKVTPPMDNQDDASASWQFVEQEQKPGNFKVFSHTIRFPSRVVSYFERIPTAFSRRQIKLSVTINRALRVLAVLTVLGCTGLAIYSGATQSVLLDVKTLEQMEYYCTIVAGVSMTAFLLSAVLALIALPEQPVVQIICSMLALSAIVCVSGGMVAQLLLKSQVIALPSPTEVSIIGRWMNNFGWGGVMAFSSGAFGCLAIMFVVEMILFRWKGTWVDPMVTIFALPAAFVYQFGNKNMRFFQRLLRFAFFGRLLLHALNLIIVLPPYLLP